MNKLKINLKRMLIMKVLEETIKTLKNSLNEESPSITQSTEFTKYNFEK